MNRKEIKERAKEILHKNFWKTIKPYLIVMIISFIVTTILHPNPDISSTLINFVEGIILYPLYIGLRVFSLKVIRKGEYDDIQIFMSYKRIIIIVGLMILINFFTFLWTLLLVIPGIIAALSYSMAPYLMADGNEDPLECIRESKKMMYGYKWDYFKFMFSFFGWLLISVVAFWYVFPYYMISESIYYDELKKLSKIN